MIFDIINRNVNFWDSKNNIAFPALLKYGYSKYMIKSIAGLSHIALDQSGLNDDITTYGEMRFTVYRSETNSLYEIMINASIVGRWNLTGQNGYLLIFTNTGKVAYFNISNATPILLEEASITISDNIYYEFKRIYNDDGSHKVYIKGGSFSEFTLIIDVIDNVFNTSKYFTIFNTLPNDEFYKFSNNDLKYDVSNIINDTGAIEIQAVLGVDNSFDAKGNELEVSPNAGFSNTGNTIDWVRGDAGLQAIADAYSIPNPISHAQLLAIDFSVIPELDIRVDFKDGIFTNWAVLKQNNN